jgi:hypothetical protein
LKSSVIFTVTKSSNRNSNRRDSNGSARRPEGREGAHGCAPPGLNRGPESRDTMSRLGGRVPRLSLLIPQPPRGSVEYTRGEPPERQ